MSNPKPATKEKPQWVSERQLLIERLKQLQQRPLPTLEKMRAQFKASAEFRGEMLYANSNFIR